MSVDASENGMANAKMTIAIAATETTTWTTTTRVMSRARRRRTGDLSRHSRIHASNAWETTATGTRLILCVPPEYYWGGPPACTEDILDLLGKCRECFPANTARMHLHPYTHTEYGEQATYTLFECVCVCMHFEKQQASAPNTVAFSCAGVLV